jgi:3-methyladenine DNA glycosylase AlkD
MYPEFVSNLKGWTGSENRWLRRAAAVTLILPARKGDFLEDVFEMADLLLSDDDDLVQKGYGWMLKEASKKHQQEVFDYVMRNKASMPRTALRYAIEKMPEDLRLRAMER